MADEAGWKCKLGRGRRGCWCAATSGLKLLKRTVTSECDSHAGIRWGSQSKNTGPLSGKEKESPWITISANSSYCQSLKDTSMAGDRHQLTILGFWQPHLHRKNIMIRNLASADRNPMSRLRAILSPLSSVRSEHPWSTVPSSEHHTLIRTMTNTRKIRRQQSAWGVEDKLVICIISNLLLL